MNKFFKKFSAASFITSSSFLPISCISYNNENQNKKLDSYIEKSKDVLPTIENSREKITEKIIKKLVSLTFKNDAKKIEYLNNFKNETYVENIKKQFKKMADEFYKLKLNGNKSELDKHVLKMKTFYSENWYFVLNNLKDFDLEFYEWLLFPDHKNGKHSKEYKEKLSDLDTPGRSHYLDNYIDELKEGEESFHFDKTDIYYILKSKTIFRITIDSTSNDSPKMLLDPFVWGFPLAKASKISVNLISNLVHSAYIHGDQSGFNRFEKDMVDAQRYGYPAVLVLLMK